MGVCVHTRVYVRMCARVCERLLSKLPNHPHSLQQSSKPLFRISNVGTAGAKINFGVTVAEERREESRSQAGAAVTPRENDMTAPGDTCTRGCLPHPLPSKPPF